MEPPTLRVISANLRNSLADKATIADITRVRADVFGFAEALLASTTKREQQELQALYGELGYDVYFALSDDADDRGDQHYLGLLVDRSLTHRVAQIRLGTRNAIALTIGTLLVVMVHLDDRLELTRLGQVQSLMSYIDANNGEGMKRVLVMGDFNAAHPSRFGRLLGLAGRSWTKFDWPIQAPDDSAPRQRIGRIGSLLTRLGSMATSRALAPLDDFHTTRFEDVDRHHKPTMPRHFPLVQLDHMFVYNGVTLPISWMPTEPMVRGFRRSAFGCSDHLALGVEIQVDE